MRCQVSAACASTLKVCAKIGTEDGQKVGAGDRAVWLEEERPFQRMQ